MWLCPSQQSPLEKVKFILVSNYADVQGQLFSCNSLFAICFILNRFLLKASPEKNRLLFSFLSEHVTLLFVGDISFSGPVKYYVEHNYHSYNDSFRDVAPFIREADISVANLESPFVSKDVYRYKYKGMKMVYLYSSPEAASALRYSSHT